MTTSGPINLCAYINWTCVHGYKWSNQWIICIATRVQQLDSCAWLQMVQFMDLCAWQEGCNQLDLYAWTWVHGTKWTCVHGYKHGLGCMPNHMLQTSHVWLLKSNKSHHASMVTRRTTCDAWFQNKRQHGKHGYKKVQHGYFVHVLELHDMWSYKAIQKGL